MGEFTSSLWGHVASLVENLRFSFTPLLGKLGRCHVLSVGTRSVPIPLSYGSWVEFTSSPKERGLGGNEVSPYLVHHVSSKYGAADESITSESIEEEGPSENSC